MTMKNLPFMPMYWGEYLGATPHFTKAQHGAYLLLIAFHWQNGKLPADEDTTRKVAKCSAREWPSMRKVLAPMFDTSVLPWKHHRVLTELGQAFEIVRSKRDTLTHTSTHTEKRTNGHGKYRGKTIQQAAREYADQCQREFEEAETSDRLKSSH